MREQKVRRLVACLVGGGVLVALLAVGGPVGGSALATIAVSSHQAATGSSVTVTGTCEPNTSGYALSTAFLRDASHEFAGVGAAPFSTDAGGNFSVVATISASATPGTYTISGRCGGGNIGVTASVQVTNPVAPPTPMVPGRATFTG